MRKAFLVLSLSILCGCAPTNIKVTHYENLLPPKEKFSLVNDTNITKIPSLLSLIQIQGLESLVARGLENNYDWKVQLAQIQVVRTKLGLSISGSQPSLTTQIAWQDGREKTRESGFTEKPLPNWQGAALFNWEIDMWGKWKAIKESSIMHLHEAEYYKEAAKITFIHEIARAWVTLASQTEHIYILGKLIESQRKSTQFYKLRVDVGEENNSTLARHSLAYERLLIEQARLQRLLQTTKLRLQYLIGDALDPNLPDIQNLSKIRLPQLPKVFPTTALKERPDLKAKEAKLKENLYLEKSKTYDLYPSFAFQASGISMSSDLSEPFQQWKASLGPVLNIPIWNPQIKSQIKVTKAQSKLYKEEWKASVSAAIEEIESATKSFLMSKKELSLATKAHQKAGEISSITNAKFEAGIASMLDFWADEKEFYETQRQVLTTRLQVFHFALDLSKSLGLQMEPRD
jgi:outer membrane protein TolC